MSMSENKKGLAVLDLPPLLNMAHLDIINSNIVFDVLQEWEDVLEPSEVCLGCDTSSSPSLE